MTSIEHESNRPVKDSQDSVRSREFSDKRLEGASIVRALDLPESSEIVFLNWRPGAAGQILEKTFRSYHDS